MKYLDEAKRIWQTFVPKAGQAETVQGELLRAVEKLRNEAQRNGNMNWDSDFELLLAFLERHLLDTAVFSAATCAATRASLDQLHRVEHPTLNDDLYDNLGDRVVEYYKHYGSRPHERNPRLMR